MLNDNDFTNAVKRNRIDMLDCIWNHGYQDLVEDEHDFIIAASKGHLDVIKWLLSKNRKWQVDASLSAAKHNHSSIIEWAILNNLPLHPDVPIVTQDVALIELALNHGCVWNQAGFEKNGFKNDIQFIKWAFKKGYLKNKQSIKGLKAYGYHYMAHVLETQ
jgi:hypothetical protein